MKPTSSSRSLTGGASGHTARTAMASPLAAAGKKTRRSSADKPSTAEANYPYVVGGHTHTMSSPELLFQLQQFQHQQQLHHHGGLATYGYQGGPAGGLQSIPSGYAPFGSHPPLLQRIPGGMMAPVAVDDSFTQAGAPVSHLPGPQVSTENGEDLVGRIEKKDQMITQLGSFLSQMKQESEGTAHAWKEKMQEIAELKRQVALLGQQLRESQDKEKQTADQLAQVTEDIQLAVHGLKEADTKHLEELNIMNDEIQRRQSEQDRAKEEYESTIRRVSDKLTESERRLEDMKAQYDSLEAIVEKEGAAHRRLVDQIDEQRRNSEKDLEEVQTQLQVLEKEKQELGQHLWDVTQALNKASRQEHSLQARLEEAMQQIDQNQSVWSERVQTIQKEKAELIAANFELQAQVQHMQGQVLEERSQKEQINALMGEEMQRVGDEMKGFHQEYTTKLDQHEVEIEHWKNEATALQEKLFRAEGQYVVTRKELDEWQARASQIDEEYQQLEKNGSEKALTLQEINEQLRQTLGELHDTRARFDQLLQRCEYLEAGVSRCEQHLPVRSSDSEDPIPHFPDSVVNALEEWRRQAGHVEQIKISTLRLQQDRDNERDRFRAREQELIQKTVDLQTDVDSAKADAAALAQELKELNQLIGGNEAKSQDQVQRLAKELDECRSASGLQVLQLQKMLDSQKARVQQLEGEKRDLLREAESMNTTVESLYQSKNEKQAELDQLKATWKELQAEHADFKESVEDLETNYESSINDVNEKARELQQQVQDTASANDHLARENALAAKMLADVKADFEEIGRQYAAEQLNWNEQDRQVKQTLSEKANRLDEMMDVLTQLRSRNDYLEQARATDDHAARAELDKLQQQLLHLNQERKRVETAYISTKAQLDQVMPELFTLKEEKKHFSQSHGELEDAVSGLKGEILRLQGELERVGRARSTLQLELNRVSDEGEDLVRQFEVLRRDAKSQEKRYVDEAERMRKEIEEVRQESSESAAMVEELQAKMTSVQNAANATINELMNELQNVQDTMGYDKTKLQKENEMLKTHARAIEDELRKRDADVKEIQNAFRQEKDCFAEKENEMTMKMNRMAATLESRKQEVDRLVKELEVKGLKAAEYERKLNPLVNARDNLQAKCNEMRQSLDNKLRETRDLEERYRDELSRAMKDKRDVETMYLAMKEDYEMIKSQSNGQQQQWQSEFRSVKHNLERTKADLVKANAEVSALTQRLDSSQQHAQETIEELVSRLQAADQQKEVAVNALQREINVERERRREAEVQKMELQRLVRQRATTQSSNGTHDSSVVIEPNEDAWGVSASGPASLRLNSPVEHHQQESLRGSSAPETIHQSQPDQLKSAQSSVPADYRKFYANEPMTNAELANLPMNLIKAQIGLDFAGEYSSTESPTRKSITKPAPRVTTKAAQRDNNDDIPLLSLEKLPQNPEASTDENSPTCDTSSSRIPTDKRSGAVSLLASLSARSNSDRYMFENLECSSRPQRSSSGLLVSSSTSNSNNKKKQPSAKKKRPSVMPSSSAAAAAAYGGFSSLPVPMPSPPKMKSNSKLLPRIQQ